MACRVGIVANIRVVKVGHAFLLAWLRSKGRDGGIQIRRHADEGVCVISRNCLSIEAVCDGRPKRACDGLDHTDCIHSCGRECVGSVKVPSLGSDLGDWELVLY